MLFQQNIEQVDVILASTTITTSPVTTLGFDTADYAIEDCKVKLIVEQNGGTGSIDYEIQYSPTDAFSGTGLDTPTALDISYNVGGEIILEQGKKLDALSLVGLSAVKDKNYQVYFVRPTLIGRKVPNTKFQVKFTPTGLTGTNKITVVLIKGNK